MTTGRALPAAITAEEGAAMVRSGDWVEFFTSFTQPDLFDAALAARAGELRDVKIRACFTLKPRAVLDADPGGDSFTWLNWHFSPYDRRKHEAGICHFIPMNLGEASDYYRRFIEPPDIAVLRARPMDGDGWFNLSATNVWHRAILERSKTVIIETAPGHPFVHGPENRIHCSEVDYVIEGRDDAPVAIAPKPATEVERRVGALIAGEIGDGACLQIGIGGMSNSVCLQLIESGIRDLGVHTEMLTEGIVELYDAGRVTGRHKTLDPEKVVFSFGVGSERMYEVLDGNEDFLCCPSDYTNMPHIIMRNRDMVAINNTTQIDLQGQASSESDGYRHLSGSGGQLQFVRGAYAAENGKSFICLPSTFEKDGERRSRIVADLTRGSIVTTPRTDMMYVVTEYGIVNLKGKSLAERAKALVSIAHPDYREELERTARERGLIPRTWH